MKRYYTFDITLTTSLRVEAPTQKEAEQMIRAKLDGALGNFGAWPNGDPILCEVGIEGELDFDDVEVVS